MRVTMVTTAVSGFGAGILAHTHGLARALQARGDTSVQVIGSRVPTPGGDGLRWDGIPVTALDTVGPALFAYSPRLPAALRATSPDVMHTHGLWKYRSIAVASHARRSGVPYVVSPHGNFDPWELRHKGWRKALARRLFEDRHLLGAACLHAHSPDEALALREVGLRNPVCVVTNGVDIPPPGLPAGPPPWDPAAEGGGPVLLFMGRLHPKKGLAGLLRAWALARRDAPPAVREWRLVLAGWDCDGHEREIRRDVRALGLADSVLLTGGVFGPHREAAYAAAAAVVLPSLGDWDPVCVLEAWARGRAVAMTEACHLPAGFAAGAALRLGPEPSAMAEGLRDLFAMTPSERATMGGNGRRLVEERYAWGPVAADLRSVYAWIRGGPPPREGLLF